MIAAIDGEADTSRLGLTIFAVPPGLLGRKGRSAVKDGMDDVIVEFDGAFWLIGDLHAKNYVIDAAGRGWIIDLLAGRIPPDLAERAPRMKEHLDAIAAASAGREG